MLSHGERGTLERLTRHLQLVRRGRDRAPAQTLGCGARSAGGRAAWTRRTGRTVYRVSFTILAVANLNDPGFDEHREHPGFQCRRARLGRQVGAERLGLSLWEIPPGQAAYPYHYHLGEEELIVILSGQLSLRGFQGWRELREGEIVSFPVGEVGVHQIVNRSDQPARMLAFSTSGAPDIVIRPESGTIGVFERRPEGGGLYSHFRADDAVSYFEGEEHPEPT